MLPCSSKVEIPHLLSILENGTDGVEVVACPEQRCRFLVGSLRVEKRIQYTGSLLEEIRMGRDRIGLSRAQELSGEELVQLAVKRAAVVKKLRPNPMKRGETT